MIWKLYSINFVLCLAICFMAVVMSIEIYKDEGSSVIIDCLVDNSLTEDSIVVWKKDKLQFNVDENSRFSQIRRVSEKKVILLIKDVERGDSGIYNCFTNQRDGNRETHLLIRSQPVIRAGENSYPMVVGQKLSILCMADGNPIPKVFWYFSSYDQSQPLKDRISTNTSERIYQEALSGNSTLNFRDLSINDEGSYMCVADNSARRNAERTINLKVRLDLQVLSERYKYVSLGSTTELVFELSGNPPPKYHSWESNSFHGTQLPTCQEAVYQKFCERVLNLYQNPKLNYLQTIIRISDVTEADLGYYRLSISDTMYAPYVVYNATNLLLQPSKCINGSILNQCPIETWFLTVSIVMVISIHFLS